MEMGGRRIPEDVMEEILKRLPVKSVLRFKSTSKAWCDLIKSPHFIKSHLRFSRKSDNDDDDDDGFLFTIREKGSPRTDLDFSDSGFSPLTDDLTRFMMFPDESLNGLPVKLNTDYLESVVDFRYIRMISSCDGILCLSEWCQTHPKVTLWNPVTRQYKSLPNSNRYTISDQDMDKEYAKWDVAFGSDTKNDDYKVVAFLSFYRLADYGVNDTYITGYTEVYTLKSNSWRLVDSFIPSHSPDCKFLNAHGFVHRVVDDNVLLSFDLEEEVYRYTRGPPSQRMSQCIEDVTLASSNSGSKNIVAMYYCYWLIIEVWALNEHQFGVGEAVDDGWTLKYTVDGDQMDQIEKHPLRLWKSCLLLLQYKWDPDEDFVYLCLYNPCTKITKSICRFPAKTIYPYLGHAPVLDTFGWKETLVSLT